MLTSPRPLRPGEAPDLRVATAASRLVAEASLEIGRLDLAEFDEARGQLRPGQRVYVSHLPGQAWKDTVGICSRLSDAGFEPVPHLPVRLLADARELDEVLRAVRGTGAREPLLISGDYPHPRGVFTSVLQVLQTGTLQALGFEGVSLAGHPEGHPRVPWDEICQAQVDKWRLASGAGLRVTVVSQFLFAAEPLLHWARWLRASGVDARILAGVAGPTGLGRLIRLAAHCGVGSSLRTLTSNRASLLRLASDHCPDALIRDLAAARVNQEGLFDGLHLFSLGGFKRTAAWLRRFDLHCPT